MVPLRHTIPLPISKSGSTAGGAADAGAGGLGGLGGAPAVPPVSRGEQTSQLRGGNLSPHRSRMKSLESFNAIPLSEDQQQRLNQLQKVCVPERTLGLKMRQFAPLKEPWHTGVKTGKELMSAQWWRADAPVLEDSAFRAQPVPPFFLPR